MTQLQAKFMNSDPSSSKALVPRVSNSKLRKSEIGKELKNENKPYRPLVKAKDRSFREVFKVSKGAKIRNREPHLTQRFSVQILRLILPF